MSEEEIVKDTEEKTPEKVGIFRKKSIERISSPEQLHDYIRVTTPGVWLVLIAIIILLVGVVICIQGICRWYAQRHVLEQPINGIQEHASLSR